MSPKSSQQLEGMREEKKALIIDAALLLFADRGFHATTISDIAKRADISKGLMYNYFEGKEDLLGEIIRKSFAEIFDSPGIGFPDLSSDRQISPDEFGLIVRRLSRLLRDKSTFWRLLFQVFMQPGVRKQFSGIFREGCQSYGAGEEFKETTGLSRLMKTMNGYFERKKLIHGNEHDSGMSPEMFFLTMKGFALTYVFMDPENFDSDFFEKTVDDIIDLYK
jgi:hypothetical protein